MYDQQRADDAEEVRQARYEEWLASLTQEQWLEHLRSAGQHALVAQLIETWEFERRADESP